MATYKQDFEDSNDAELTALWDAVEAAREGLSSAMSDFEKMRRVRWQEYLNSATAEELAWRAGEAATAGYSPEDIAEMRRNTTDEEEERR